jgi:general secretion pathway protein L
MRQRIETALQLMSRCLRWWAAELQSCAHDLTGFLVPQRRRAWCVYWDATRLLFVDESASGAKTIAEISCIDAMGHAAENPTSLLAGIREQNNRIRVFVSSKRAYVRQFQLPSAVLPHLNAAVALQLPKLLPLDPSELLTDFEVIAGGPSQKPLNIEIAALKRAEVDTLLNRLKAWGLRTIATHLKDPSDPAYRFRFGSDAIFSHRFILRRSDRVLAAIAATLGLACVSVAATESYRSQVSLERAKALSRVPASEALAQRQELLARLEPLYALTQIESVPSTTTLLAELTMLVPQNAWLTTLDLKDNHIRIVGVSPNAGDVVRLMSSSLLLKDIALRSSTSLGIGTGLDRFELTADLNARAP